MMNFTEYLRASMSMDNQKSELTCEGRAGIAAGQTFLSGDGGSLKEGRDAHAAGPRGVQRATSRSLHSINIIFRVW